MKNFAKRLSQDIFLIATITFVVYFALELAFEGLISNYFDLNILIVVIIVSGGLKVYLEKKEKVQPLKKNNI